LPDVRGAAARSAQIGSRCGIAHAFQVSEYSGEPFTSKLACNLLAKDNWRAADRDKAEELGPEVALVGCSGLLAGCAERLAWAGAGPEGPVIGPSSQSSCVSPSADAGEEVALRVVLKVIGLHLHDAACVHIASGYVPGGNQVAKPLGRIGVDLVVVGGH